MGSFTPRLKKMMKMMMMKNIKKTHVAVSSGAAEGIKWRIWNTFILITKSICHCGFSLIFNIPRIIAFRGFYNNRFVAWNIFWFYKTPGSQTPVTTHSPDTIKQSTVLCSKYIYIYKNPNLCTTYKWKPHTQDTNMNRYYLICSIQRSLSSNPSTSF